ncbi:hypothetical protein EX895_002514 [Sporisorium graminicola]|uniref:Uncharacterized protein n=1 Tax=Sporisorium graminicola TaxID=280036 RepID=A0A4U7KWD7_9BASI|nr:hypothetical protein EX895_002514 [Sporisorium graminicola]TKY88526.1 hypothetical protein EX895_002514 [Sporisorium graminicola]
MQAIQSKQIGTEGWLQDTVRSLGSYAQTSTPAYTLAALFALSTPFGFASPAQAAAEAAAKLQRQKQLAQASTAASSQGSNGLVARLVANVQAQKVASAQMQPPLRTVPPFWQLAFFAAAFSTGGYMIDQGDQLNGSGVITAWSLTYLIFKTAPSLKQLPKNPLALSLSAAVLSVGLGVHGSHYFDRTSWRGAMPSLAGAGEAEVSTKGRSSLLSFDTFGKTDQTKAPASIFASGQYSTMASAANVSEQVNFSAHASLGSARNNDQARTVAFLRRQGSSQPAPIVA